MCKQIVKYFNNKKKKFPSNVTDIIAIAIPNLEDLISLMGALCLSFMGIALPAIINFLTFNHNYKKKGVVQYSIFCLHNIILVLISIFVLTTNLLVSMQDFVKYITDVHATPKS